MAQRSKHSHFPICLSMEPYLNKPLPKKKKKRKEKNSAKVAEKWALLSRESKQGCINTAAKTIKMSSDTKTIQPCLHSVKSRCTPDRRSSRVMIIPLPPPLRRCLHLSVHRPCPHPWSPHPVNPRPCFHRCVTICTNGTRSKCCPQAAPPLWYQ